MFDYLLDQPLPDCSKTEEGGAKSSSQTLRETLREEGFHVDSSDEEENDVVFIKELILGCPIGQQHQAKCDPTVSHFHYTSCSHVLILLCFRRTSSQEGVKKSGFCMR